MLRRRGNCRRGLLVPCGLEGRGETLDPRHLDRTALGKEFGATDIVPERGAEGIERVRELTGGLGVRHVVEAVGTPEAWDMAIGMARVGGRIGAVSGPRLFISPYCGALRP